MKKRSISSVARGARSKALAMQAAAKEPTLQALDRLIEVVDQLGSYFERTTTVKTQEVAVGANRSLESLRGVRHMIESGRREPEWIAVNREALDEALDYLIRVIDRAYPRR